MASHPRTPIAAPAVEPPARDVTMPAFHAEVTSDEFWETVQARRAAGSASEKLDIDARYRRQRAERAAAELRG